MGIGVSDVTIASGIIITFIVLGTVLPYIHQAFGSSAYNTVNVAGVKTEAGTGTGSIAAITLGTVLFSVLKMFFWTFGLVSAWVELVILMPMRIALAIIAVRNFPVIGAGGN